MDLRSDRTKTILDDEYDYDHEHDYDYELRVRITSTKFDIRISMFDAR